MPLKGKNSENFQTSSGAIALLGEGRVADLYVSVEMIQSLWDIFTGLEGILIFYIYMQK